MTENTNAVPLPEPTAFEPYESHYSNGTLFSHYHINHESKCAEGHAFWNFPNGQRVWEGIYLRGVRAGCWREFASDGSVRQVLEFGTGEYTKPQQTESSNDFAITPETAVLLDEEYRYRCWFWLPGWNLARILNWWRRLPFIEPFGWHPGMSLPGILIERRDAYDRWNKCSDSGSFITGHIHDEDDSFLRLPGGELIKHAGRLFAAEHNVD